MDAKTIGQTINALPVGKFQTLDKIKPSGSIQARKQASGAVQFYWRYSFGTKSDRVPVGLYDPTASPKSLTPTEKGYSFAAAVRAAEEIALKHYTNKDDGGLPALEAAEQAEKAAAENAKAHDARHTLKHLLEDYCNYLASLDRSSHTDARNIFKNHVFEAWPKVAAKPAKEVTGEEFADMMRRLHDADKGRTANKLRSYARAAYQTAKGSRSKAKIPLHFKQYGITHNPVSDTEPDEEANETDKSPLQIEDMRKLWELVKDVPGFKGAILQLHVLTGGQRVKQLLRVRTEHVRDDSFTIVDRKGRPGKPPRLHVVPLTAKAAQAMKTIKPQGEWAFSTDGGKRPLSPKTFTNWVDDVIGDKIAGFTPKRVRSGVETALASVKVSKEIRGHLQSHGIGGVQARHYDGYEYLDEKRQALEVLYRQLQPPSPNVTPLRAKKRA